MTKIKKTKSGKWNALVYMGKDENGKRINKSITHADRKYVKLEVDRLERMRESGYVGLSFKDAMKAYIACREPVLSPSTIRGYKSIERVLTSLFPDFCNSSIDDIDKSQMQAVVNALISRENAPKRVRNIYGFITATLRYHERPVPHVALPDANISNSYEPTMQDIQKLREVVSGTELDIPVRLGLHGLRQGEVCALKYPDDFQDGYIIVSKSMVEKPDWSYTIKAPKNKTSNRIVPIIDSTLIDDIQKQGFVTDLLPDNLGYRFASMIKRNNLPHIRFHDLRHFFASYLHSKGVPDALIMKYGGWKTDNVMKRVYRYALDDNSTVETLRESFADDFIMQPKNS